MTRRISTIIALTLAVGATVAPASLARPDFAPPTTRSTATPTATQPTSPARSHDAQRVADMTAYALGRVAAARQGPAAARQIATASPSGSQDSRPADLDYSTADMTAYALGRVAAARQGPAAVRQLAAVSPSDSFSYGDAAVGAAAAAAAAAFIAAGTVARRRRGRLQNS